MKKLMYFGLFFCLNLCIAQSDADYENTMKNIIDSYNANDSQKIFDQFSTDLQATFTIDKVKEFLTTKLEDQGKFSDFDFMYQEDDGKRYLVQSDNDSIILVIALSADLKVTKFGSESE